MDVKGLCSHHDDVIDKMIDQVVADGRYVSIFEGKFLLPRELENLLVAGRCISVDHRVHQATKEIPACMATGEAAGEAAALSIRTGVDPPALDVAKLRSTLAAGGAVVALPPRE